MEEGVYWERNELIACTIWNRLQVLLMYVINARRLMPRDRDSRSVRNEQFPAEEMSRRVSPAVKMRQQRGGMEEGRIVVVSYLETHVQNTCPVHRLRKRDYIPHSPAYTTCLRPLRVKRSPWCRCDVWRL